jgi:HK97 family phage prohead protease/HK97 family phage major capsid protein
VKPSRQPPALRSVVRRLAEVHVRDAAESESGDRTLDVIASDETVDRYGDVVSAAGWQLAEFTKNPIALWMHSYDAPIGNVENVRVEGKRLLARIRFATAGVSERVDELWRLVKAGVLRAVSVGFMVDSEADYEFIRDADENVTGYRFLRQQLLEVSLVTVPANPNAVALAKSLVADPRAYLHEDSPMEPTEQPAGALRPIAGPVNLSSALPADLSNQVERNGRCSFEVRRSIRDIAMTRNVLGETIPAGAGVGVPTTVRLVDGLLAPAPLLLSLLTRVPVEGGSITQNTIHYQPTDSGNKAAIVAEAQPKPESDLAASSSVLAFALWAHHVGVTKQALADLPALRQLVDSVLTRGLLVKVDGGVLTALSGAATAFVGGVGSLPADNAAVAAAQLAALGGSSIVVAMNPTDLVAIDTAKASGSGVYVGRPPINGQLVGVPSIPAGKLLAFASESAYLAEREAVNVVAGLANDDFTKNIVRLLAEWRGITVIQVPALILYGDAAGAISVTARKTAA